MPTIAQLKQQVDRIWVASFQTDLTDTLATHLRRSSGDARDGGGFD